MYFSVMRYQPSFKPIDTHVEVRLVRFGLEWGFFFWGFGKHVRFFMDVDREIH